MASTKNLIEKELVRIWQRQWLAPDTMVTEDGQPLQVIYPGRLSDEEGPDFRDAVVVIGRGLSRGDIEIHLKSSGWQEHNHHRDANYNHVILHVVLRHNIGIVARLQNGGAVPVLALEKYIAIPVEHRSGSTFFCQASQSLDREKLLAALDRAGEERFIFKAPRFQKDLMRVEASQCLYQGIMSALGYSRNKIPFQELARRVPLSRLESLTGDNITEADWLARRQELLLGTAGLLPGPPQPDCLPREAWRLLRVRPNNSPVTRIVAMSHLLRRYREPGLLHGLLNLVREAPPGRNGYKSLEDGLIIIFDGQTGRTTLLGRARAADIVVNVLLPFALAWSQTNAESELGNKALNLYRGYPRLAINSAEIYMSQQLKLSAKDINSARRQQGLIHIYKNQCGQGRCQSCPLRQLQSRHRI